MNQWHNDLADTLPLDGPWQLTLAGQDAIAQVPGSWEAQGYPRRVDGPAVYRRRIAIPAGWMGRHVQLQCDAASYHTEVRVNGAVVGEHTGSWSPFAIDITAALRPGVENDFELTLYKQGERYPLRESLAGFLPDVAMMFGGLWQSVRLVAFDGPALSDVTVLADAAAEALTVTARIQGVNGPALATVRVKAPDGEVVAVWGAEQTGSLRATLTIDQPALWSPDHPALYTVEVTVRDGDGQQARVRRQAGFRALTHDGDQLLFNNTPVCLRGVLNWGWYPDVLCPAPDEATIRAEFARVRRLGFNLIKLCLYVPSARYLELADEEGMFLWLELPMWLPEVTPRLRQQAPAEYAEILSAVHHHPSIILYSLGCELSHAVDAEMIEQLDTIVRGGTVGALHCDNSGSGEAYGGLSFDFADFNDYHFYCDLQYFEPLVDHFSRDWRPPRPWIFGEFCDADDYRDLAEIAAARGGELPWWLTEWNPLHSQAFVGYPAQQERMRALDLGGLDDSALQRLSRQQSFVIRKTILEKVRARAGMGGYVVTGIRDTPLSTSAIFDDLSREKYPPQDFRQFNADTVLLLGRGRRRLWTHGGDRPVPAEPYSFLAGQPVALDIILAHAGAPLPGGSLTWEVRDQAGQALAHGGWEVPGPLPGGAPRAIGRLTFAAPAEAPAALRLDVSLQAESAAPIRNAWPLWVFPAVEVWPEGLGLLDPAGTLFGLDDLRNASAEVIGEISGVEVLITNTLDGAVRAYLSGGGKVLLIQSGPRPLPALGQPFWREAIKLVGDHPIMNALSHEGVVDLQFYGLATDWAFDTSRLEEALPEATGVRALLRRLDARQFRLTDYLLDMQVGRGRLIATTLRFAGGQGDQPPSLRGQLAGRWLLRQLLADLLSS